MGMRYKTKVLSNLEIIVNKIHNLTEAVDKNLIRDKESLIRQLRSLENDQQIVMDMVEKEESTFHAFEAALEKK